MTNADWIARSQHAVWHPCTQMKRHESFPLLPIARAEGVWLTDFDGRRYLDAVSSWWVNLFGHGEPRIKAALIDQLNTLDHVMLAGFTHAPVVALSERLAALSGLGHAFYGSDGASAVEIALKMSFHFWRNQGQPRKTRFLHLENSYHGETLGALAVTDVAIFRDTYAPLLKGGMAVASPDARLAQLGETAAAPALRAAHALEATLAVHADEIAALIVEPLVQGAAGMVMYDPCYLAEARRLCDHYGVHLIADEIAVGFGRTGTLFAYQQAAIRPDFVCLSKGITGGTLPLSCVLTTEAVYAAFYHDDLSRGFLHSHSYTGNPLACRAALAVLDIFAEDNTLTQNRAKAASFAPLFAPLQAHPAVRAFRQCGMIWAFEVDSPRGDFAQAFFRSMLAQGCLVRPIGKTVYFMPPYCIEAPEMAMLIAATLTVLAALSAETPDAAPEAAMA